MSRSTILNSGQVAFRTALLSQARAESFAAMLTANSRFESVLVNRSERAKCDKAFFVTFQPSSEARKDLIFMAQWDARKERGQGEGADYTFFADEDNKGCYWVYNPISQETYSTSIFSCSCPDYTYRCQRAGLQCKHQAAHTEFLRRQNAA